MSGEQLSHNSLYHSVTNHDFNKAALSRVGTGEGRGGVTIVCIMERADSAVKEKKKQTV